jgi:hypothetical protein
MLYEEDITIEGLRLIIPEMKKDILKREFKDKRLRRLLSKIYNGGCENGLNLLSKCYSNKLGELEHSLSTIIYHLYNNVDNDDIHSQWMRNVIELVE